MGKLLNDRYELDGLLGAGGMGAVHRAHDRRLGRDVAIKVLRGEQVDDETSRARLRAEARIAGGLHHPGMATVFDYGEDEDSDLRDPFIVMQLVEGVTLSASLRERERMGHDEVVELVSGVADALAAAHAAGVVHRDVKPSNVVLTPSGRPVLVDFGIAASPDREPLTETGSILGTAEFISPEQARGRLATPASDVYSLGVVAFQCLTGASPFRRDTSVATALAQVGDPLPPFPDGTPRHLARLIEGMTSKDPDDRPTAADVAATVRRVADESTADLAVPNLRTHARLRTLHRVSRRQSRAMASIAVVLVGALAFGMSGGAPWADQTVSVPDVVGSPVDRATDLLDEQGLTGRQDATDDPTAQAGTVLAQDPPAGTPTTDDVVTLRVATGRM